MAASADDVQSGLGLSPYLDENHEVQEMLSQDPRLKSRVSQDPGLWISRIHIHCKVLLQEDTRNSFLRPPTNVVLERELRRDTSMRKGDANGSVLGSVDETQMFASQDQTSDGRNGLSSSRNGDSQATERGDCLPFVPNPYNEDAVCQAGLPGCACN